MAELSYMTVADLTAKRGEDGFLYVKGLATDDTLDLDHQICDPKWLDTAVPKWARTAGNVREMHQPSAVGRAVSIEKEGTGWYVEAKIVDESAAKKVEEGVYTAYSIGIKNATVEKDGVAKNGRISAGEIVEISLVDRPANPSSSLSIVKTVDGEAVFSDVVEKANPVDFVDAAQHPSPVTEGEAVGEGAKPCTVCNGIGHTTDPNFERPCEHCNGTGKEPEGNDTDPLIAPTPANMHTNDNRNLGDHKSADPDDEDETPVAPIFAKGDISVDTFTNAIGQIVKVTHLPTGKSATAATTEAAFDVLKREFSDKEREAAARSGAALPDGSYPIKSVADLKNAIQAFGRAKDPAKVKAHIKARAKALGREDLIPDSWKSVDADIEKDAGQWLHDPAELAQVRNLIVSLIKAELDEFAKGEDETSDIAELVTALNLFHCWWQGEANEGEVPAPFQEDDMAYIGLGVSPDLIKRASAEDATDEDKTAVRDEIRKALGVDEMIADTEANLAKAVEVIENLQKRLDEVEQLAAPTEVRIRQTTEQKFHQDKIAELTVKSIRYHQLAEAAFDANTKAQFVKMAEDCDREIATLSK